MGRPIGTMVVVLLVCLAALGFYRGWFTLGRGAPVPGSEKVNVNLTVDPGKVKADVKHVQDKASELTGQETQ